MTRIKPAPSSEATSAMEARIIATRGEITKLYRILLNSPAVCEGWESLLTAIRQKTSLPPDLRELIILRIAILNRAPYEFSAHLPHGRKAGLSDTQMECVKGDDRSPLSPVQTLALAYADAMTSDIQVPDALFARIQAAFDAQGLIDLTATIAAYNMVSRFLAALDVH